LPPTRRGHALERVPFLVAFAMKFLVYGTVVVLVVGGRPGGRLVRAVAAMLLSPDLAQALYVQRAPRAVLMASTFLLVGNAILVLQLSRLVGERTLRDIVFGREFGVAPRLRAALHGGPVIAGEVGGSRRAIVYHGDVMNTTSRIEQATRDLERQFLVSGDALERLTDLEGFAREDLGPQRLR